MLLIPIVHVGDRLRKHYALLPVRVLVPVTCVHKEETKTSSCIILRSKAIPLQACSGP